MGREELKYKYERIIGESSALVACLKEVDKAIDSKLPVLITGESGTGKEMIAKTIHFQGPRGKYSFISENPADISETLLETELFGYSKEAFVGALEGRKGLMEIADKRSLFLDEISEVSLGLQAKIMQAFQNGYYKTVGDENRIHFDARLICATSYDLATLVKKGNFREDFYDYVSQMRIAVPPLRERKDDIPLLVDYFLKKEAREKQGAEKEISTEAIEALVAYCWPGNARELENECKRLYCFSETRITAKDISPRIRHLK